MKAVMCKGCKKVYHVIGDPVEIKYLLDSSEWGGSYPCITPLCRSRMEPCKLTLPCNEVVGIKDFYRAIYGFGRANHAPATFTRSKELLTTKKIVSVVGGPVGSPERTLIRELVLEDGTRLHFDSSALGACLYYIEEHGPSCMEVVENEIHSDPAAQGVAESREEVGRAHKTESRHDSAAEQQSSASDGPTSEPSQPGCMSDVHEASDLPTSTTSGADVVDDRDPDLRM